MNKKLLASLISVIMIISFCGCGNKSVEEDNTTIRIGVMSGPTAMGMVKLMKDSEEGKTQGSYEFADLVTDASALVSPIASGELDIAAVPSNLASVIYNNTDGKIKVISACALGVLYLVERGEETDSLKDLNGKTIYATGQGAVPEYTIRYILNNNGIDPDQDVNIQWCADTTEALSYVKTYDDAIAVLPQPFVTAASAQVEDLRIVADLNDEWEKINPDSSIITGVIVVRTEFAEKYPELLNTFIDEYTQSVEYVQKESDSAAALVTEYGIVGAEPIAKKALPGCHIVCIKGDELKLKLTSFLNTLYEINPKAVGGSVPGDDFYLDK